MCYIVRFCYADGEEDGGEGGGESGEAEVGVGAHDGDAEEVVGDDGDD